MTTTKFNWNPDHPRLAADTTGSARADLVGFGPDGVWISRSSGDGGFLAPTLVIPNLGFNDGWRVDQHPRVLADLTGDGCADIVGFGEAGVWVARNAGRGLPPLDPRGGAATPAAATPGRDAATRRRTGLARARGPGSAPGPGTFGEPKFVLADFGSGTGWSGGAHVRLVADLTADGRADVIGFGDAGVYVALNDGTGGLSAARFVLANFGADQGWRVDRHPRVLGDLTGDGRPDIVGFGDGGVWVALNQGDGGFGEARFALSDLGYGAGWRVDQHPRHVVDITGNGCADVVGFGDAGVWVALGNGDGSFGPAQFVLPNFGVAQGWRVDRHPRMLVDLSGDGRADIVGFGDAGVWVARSNGDGTFATPQLAVAEFCHDQGWRVGEHPRLLVDVTGDGRLDIVGFGDAGVWVALGNGDGTFQPPRFVLSDLGRRSNADTVVRTEVVRDHRASPIKHVFVLMLENRSFDHMLGFSGITGTDAATGKPTRIDGLDGTEGNSFGGRRYSVSKGAPDVGASPGHGFDDALHQLCGPHATYPAGGPYPEVNNTGFVASFARRSPDAPGDVMKCFTPEQVPVLTALAREFAVCDRWFSSMPGPTGPNRMFTHGATSGVFDDAPTDREVFEAIALPGGGFEFRGGNIFGLLDRRGVKWRVYADDPFPDAALQDGVSVAFDVRQFESLARDLADSSFDASYVFIEPAYDVFHEYADGNSQHPRGSVAAGERLIKATYEAIRNSPRWEDSLLIITYDEHGGFYDHVAPGAADPTGSTGRKHGFRFEQLGPRVPAVVVSPRIPKNLIEHRQLEHVSILRTLFDIFELPPLRHARDAVSGVSHLARLDQPRTDTPARLPAAVGGPVRARLARDFRAIDPGLAQRPIDAEESDNLPTLLYSLARQHLLLQPERRAEILARVRMIRTQAELQAYAKEVLSLVAAARASGRPR